MFKINNDLSIHVTRGDIGIIELSSEISENEPYTFAANDLIRFTVMEKSKCENIVLTKDTVVSEKTEVVTIELTGDDTSIGSLKSKPVDYWYEIELNPETDPQTIVGYDDDGPKIFKLYPEGGDYIGTDI